ncbi:hypothetical protein [Tateyamaria sp. syn59]|uniref:hypothetical protein n=1 Tax=Tateyamaria sp. syn59 TaxID=2576942 RepID=UPI0011BEF761|nr:hypothetical protein [Tateyamaria sp. syn59]
MKLETLYELVQSLWPKSIAIDDAVVFDESSGRFPQLVKAWDQAEILVEDSYIYNDLNVLAVWSFYQEIHNLALQSHRLGCSRVSSTDVTVAMLDARIRSNLEIEGWEEMKALYKRSNTTNDM